MAKANKKVEKPKTEQEPEVKELKRKIHYHELKFTFNDTIDTSMALNKDPFNAFFSMIAKMGGNDKEDARYQEIMDAKIFMQNVSFSRDGTNIITGKLRYVKMDVFPELIDVKTDEITDIEAKENQGIVETTHFLIGVSANKKYLALEYNHAGAKISDFLAYCENIATIKGVFDSIAYETYTREEISTFENRINAITSFRMKIHKNNIADIEKIDKDIITGLKVIEKQFEAEYIELYMKFKIKKKKRKQGGVEQPIDQPIKQTVLNFIKALSADKNKTNWFDSLEAKARDYEKNLKVSVFDLLADKITSEISVKRKPKQRVILSDDLFEKMKQEYVNKNL